MRAMQLRQLIVMLLLAGAVPVAAAQQRILCSTVLESERDFVRRFGGCRDDAPIVDVAPKSHPAPPVVRLVPNVVGLSFDAARDRLAGFLPVRSYRASGEPGGTVLEQQPAPPARLVAGATIRVVLSDGTLRPAPRVSAADIDEPPKRLATTDLQPQGSVVTNDPPTGTAVEKSPAGAIVQPNSAVQSKGSADQAEVERLRVPNVLGMTVVNAHAQLGRFKVERVYRASSAPNGRVVAQIPKASARTAAGSAIVLIVSSGPAPVVETFELPNVVDRSYSDASKVLAEFKVARIEVVASAAPSGQVLAQDPAPGAQVAAGSVVRLQVSDGSLASAAVAAPAAVAEVAPAPAAVVEAAPAPAAVVEAAPAPAAVAEAAPAPAAVAEAAPAPAPAAITEAAPAPAPPAPAAAPPAPVQVEPAPVTFSASTAPAFIAGALLVLALLAMAMRRWLISRRPPAFDVDVEPAVQTDLTPTAVSVIDVPMTEISFSARLDEGETTIEFAAPSDADETTLEHSRELHE